MKRLNKNGETDAISRLENLQLSSEDIEDAMVIARKMMGENDSPPQHHVGSRADPMDGSKGGGVSLILLDIMVYDSFLSECSMYQILTFSFFDTNVVLYSVVKSSSNK